MLLCCCFPPADPPHGLELSCDPMETPGSVPPPILLFPFPTPPMHGAEALGWESSRRLDVPIHI